MELDGIFLDMYGTITTGDREAVEAVCVDVVRDTGAAISPHELAITWGNQFFGSLDLCNGDDFITLFEIERRTLTDTMKSLGHDVNPDPYCLKLQHYWRNPPLQPEAARFFGELKIPVCIVSNADHEDVVQVVEKNGLAVDHIVTSESARSYKPDRRIFESALELTGWRRDRVIHVGDSLHSDVGGAITMGIRNVWINRTGRIHDIGTHTADHEAASLDGIFSAIGVTPAA